MAQLRQESTRRWSGAEVAQAAQSAPVPHTGLTYSPNGSAVVFSVGPQSSPLAGGQQQPTPSICETCLKHNSPAIKAASLGHFRCLQLLHHAGHVLTARDSQGATPLHAASGNGHLNCALWLVDRTGADINAKDKTGAMPSHHAAYHGQLVCLKWLCSETHGRAAVANSADGSVPAHFAAIKGHLDVLQWLDAEADADVQDVDDNGTTPLYYAAQEGHLQLVKWFVEEKGMSPLQACHDGMTPIHAAAQAGRLDVVKFLVKVARRRPSKIKDVDGATPIHFAAVKGHADVLRFFLEDTGATGNERDEIGATPLHDAAEQGQLECVKLLAYYGAELNATDDDNLTPRQLASEHGNQACALFLKEALTRKSNGVSERDYQRELAAKQPKAAKQPSASQSRPQRAKSKASKKDKKEEADMLAALDDLEKHMNRVVSDVSGDEDAVSIISTKEDMLAVSKPDRRKAASPMHTTAMPRM